MTQYICIHGHFYQPPRENPWLEEIEFQESAYPYHDWNDRINTECYAANAMSRILDDNGRIASIVNNYSSISFNFGPTLLAWMQDKAPDTYRRIIEADAISRDRFSGHGSAMAQAYNHIILPLASRRDTVTQVKWGIADFTQRFGREPEGMWLPETAVDIQTLEVLAEEGIKFTILAPRQASRYRPIRNEAQASKSQKPKGDTDHWIPVKDNHIDATQAYLQRLPSGRSINLFFYDGPISQGIAFERLLVSGTKLSERLIGAIPPQNDREHLINIATDGETYGHHHRHGDMALAYALSQIDEMPHVELTNYGEYLEKHPPTHEVQIIENSSWSCVHGVGRWKENCGCSTGGNGGWNQSWRQPLREALDWLRDEITPQLDAMAGEVLRDPQAAMHSYIRVMLDRSPDVVQRFLKGHSSKAIDDQQRMQVLRLMELHRHLQLMYTSCGWFFDELSGIETVQVIHYAAKALSLANDLFGDDKEPAFLDRLEHAQSNLDEHGTGRDIYEKWVRPARVSLLDVGGHFAINSLFPHEPPEAPEPIEPSGEHMDDDTAQPVFCFDVNLEDSRMFTSGRVRLTFGRARISSIITYDSNDITFGALHLGDHNLMGSASHFRSEQEYEALVVEAKAAFDRADIAETIRVLDRHFGEEHRYSVMSVFRDDQRRILDHILNTTVDEIERAYRLVYENSAPLMRSLSSLGAPLPRVLRTTAEFVLNRDLQRAFSTPLEQSLNIDRIREIFSEVQSWHLELDTPGLSFELQKTMERLADQLAYRPADLELVDRLEQLANLAQSLPFEVDLWKVQNAYHDLGRSLIESGKVSHHEDADDENGEWLKHFRMLGEKLHVGV